ncbi:MAG: hypothetical protein ACKPHU_16710, partial [Planctomycetaceae bacterium]
YQNGIARSIGTDLSLGLEYRPLLSDNVLIAGGVSALLPGRGFDDLYGVTDPLAAAAGATGRAENLYGMFMDLVLTW